MKRFLVPTICVLIGCVGGAAIPVVTAQSFGPPSPTTQRWEQFCEPNGHRSDMNETLMEHARTYGEQGFELVSASTGWNTIMSCYKRPASN